MTSLPDLARLFRGSLPPADVVCADAARGLLRILEELRGEGDEISNGQAAARLLLSSPPVRHVAFEDGRHSWLASVQKDEGPGLGCFVRSVEGGADGMREALAATAGEGRGYAGRLASFVADVHGARLAMRPAPERICEWNGFVACVASLRRATVR